MILKNTLCCFTDQSCFDRVLGAKGVGEAGCIAAPPAIVNAVLDALAPLGITSIDMPLTPQKVWTLVHAARDGRLVQPGFTLPAIFTTK